MVRLVAERSVQAGHRHTIAYGRRPETPEDPRSVVDAGVGMFELDWRRRSPLSQVEVARRVRWLCDALRPDVVHLHSSFAGAVGVPALRGHCPVLYTPHAFASAVGGSAPRRALLREFERLIVRHADAVGAVSGTEAEMARTLGARRVLCVPNGIPELDAATWTEAVVRPVSEQPRVIGVGRLIPQRRPQECARILAGVADVAEVAWLGGAGYGTVAEAGFSALAEAGARPTGWLPREQILAALRDATAYLHWTAWDGLALSLLEAIACDTVAIASDVGPNRELLHPEALCTSEEDAIARLRRVVSDAEFAGRLRLAQRERAADHSASAMVRGWTGVYEELAPTPARGRNQRRPADAAP
jgi:glycosyltransferase involved in cell wall biosynthesis